MSHKVVSWKYYIVNFVIISVLMAATVIAAKVPMFHFSDNPNGINLAVALVIAALKAVFIASIFMGVWWSSRLVQVLSLTGIAFLCIFFLFTFTDYLNPMEEFGSPYHDLERPGANPIPGGQSFSLQGFEDAPASGGNYQEPPHLFGHGEEAGHGAEGEHGADASRADDAHGEDAAH